MNRKEDLRRDGERERGEKDLPVGSSMQDRLRHTRKDQNQDLFLHILPCQNNKILLRGPQHCRHCLHPPIPVTLHSQLPYVAPKKSIKLIFKREQEKKIETAEEENVEEVE